MKQLKMKRKCKKNYLRISLYRCPSCGYEIEIFSDETKAICVKCGRTLDKSKAIPCVEWCIFASKCLGSNYLSQNKKA